MKPQMQMQQPRPDLWAQNYYRIRKKVLAIANQYFIEDAQGNLLAYSKQKLLKLKEDIRIYSDTTMQYELFRIAQTQIIDAWGHFAVIDSMSGQSVGGFKRKALMSSFVADEYYILDPMGQQVGKLYEDTGRGLLRKFIKLIPEIVHLELYGQHVADIKQQFKIIGDIWEVDCTHYPAIN